MQCNASAIMQWFICAVLQSQSNAIGAKNVATPVSKWCRCTVQSAQCKGKVCVKLG